MTEKDLLFRLETICQWYREWSRDYTGDHILSPEEVGECMVYLSGKIQNPIFDRNDPVQWEQVKEVLYERLERKSPQDRFELCLGLPEGIGPVLLDEMAYGRIFMDENYNFGLRKKWISF